MAEAHHAGVADEQIETEREYRHDEDLGAELKIECGADEGKQREQ